MDDKFVIGICHKVAYFNFQVISYPFPDSNDNSALGYKTFINNQWGSAGFVITNRISSSVLNNKVINHGYDYNLFPQIPYEIY